MKMPDKLYAIYDNECDDVVMTTKSKKDVEDFLKFRDSNRYQVALITDKEHISELMGMYISGERYGEYVFTQTEFESLSDYLGDINSSYMYSLDDQILSKLKYFKLCDEDIEIINKGLSILRDKVKSIYQGPTDEDDMDDEDKVYKMDEMIQNFIRHRL